MNPLERQREFREKLRRISPRQARRYEAYLKEKKEAYTAEYAYSDMVFQEIKGKIGCLLNERGYKSDPENLSLDCEQLTDMWLGYIKSRRKQEDGKINTYYVLEKLGIHSIFSLVENYVKYAKSRIGKEMGVDGFEHSLLNELAKADPFAAERLSSPAEKMVGGLFLFHNAEHSHEVEVEGTVYKLRSKEYWIAQYKRLEKENNLHRAEAEDVFMPLLKAIYADAEIGIPHISGVGSPITFADIKEVVERAGSPDLQSFISSKSKTPNDELFSHIIQIVLTPDDEARENNAEQLKDGMLESLDRALDSDIFEELERLMKYKARSIDESESEKRIKKIYKKAEDVAMDAPPKIAKGIREMHRDNRFAIYLFNLARRRRSELPFDPFSEDNKPKEDD